MAAWAYECHPAGAGVETCLVDCMAVDSMPGKPTIVRVRIDSDWICATVDRTQRLDVQASLLRDVIASDAIDCPECAEPADQAAQPAPVTAAAAPTTPSRQLQAAAISMLGHRFVVVLVGLDLVNSPGEAEMAIADLRPRFGGVDIVLMGQHEDGTPQYHGDPALRDLLSEMPLDKMPWKSYPLG
ncbi:hypothetical protein [Piscinibacter sakaiensis]|uniref:hypothetical protein n=1 Tax=Piscinibacter sakaiensis TaxID=1547922 RepID=UPI003AB087FC